MANVNNPHGLMPIMRTLGGGPAATQVMKKAVGYGTAIFQWDAVNRVADGSIEASATPGTTLYSGVALNHGAASKATEHIVIISPDMVYVAQADGSLVEADMGLNANLVLTAGNAALLRSKHQINAATEADTNSLDVKLLQRYEVPENDWGNYVRLEVVFNKHRMAPGVAGV